MSQTKQKMLCKVYVYIRNLKTLENLMLCMSCMRMFNLMLCMSCMRMFNFRKCTAENKNITRDYSFVISASLTASNAVS